MSRNVLKKKNGSTKNQRKNRDQQDYFIVENGPNTEKSNGNFGDLLSLRLWCKPPANTGVKNSPIIIIIIIQQKTENLMYCGFCSSGRPQTKIVDGEKRDKYLDLAREQKKLWYMKVTVIPIVISALGTVTKDLGEGLEDLEIKIRVETTIKIDKHTEKGPGDLMKTCSHSASSKRPSTDAGVKNSHRSKLIILRFWKRLK